MNKITKKTKKQTKNDVGKGNNKNQSFLQNPLFLFSLTIHVKKYGTFRISRIIREKSLPLTWENSEGVHQVAGCRKLFKFCSGGL